MPTPLPIGAAAVRAGGSSGLFWGAVAGAVIGAGISLNLGLFYSSADELVCGVIFTSALLGGLFGYVMAHVLADEATLRPEVLAHQPILTQPLRGLERTVHQAPLQHAAERARK